MEVAMEKRRYADRRTYLIEAVKRRRKKVREMAVQYKGGRCSCCGYSRCIEALEFHHLDVSRKDFGISERGYTRSWEKIREEIDKCILVCANCHRELHSQMQLSAERRIEKSGELRETLLVYKKQKGNPERSPVKRRKVTGNVQRLGYEKRTQ